MEKEFLHNEIFCCSYKHDLFKTLPHEKFTKEMCIELLLHGDEDIDYLPQQFKNQEFFEELMESDGYGSVFKRIPKQFLNEKICEIFSDCEHFDIELIPEHLLTPHIFLKGILENGCSSWSYVPSDMEKEVEELLKERFKDDKTSLEYYLE